MRRRLLGRIGLLGPAFVAAIAYVDPGNIAANISGGAQYGYLLVWVLVMANIMATIVQYHSAKLGLVTDKSLPQLVGDRLGRRSRIAFWAQAEIIAAATDLAEVIGGALALNLLFHLPLLLGGFIVGGVSLIMLAVQNRYGARRYELVVIAFLTIIALGFLGGLVLNPPSPTQTLLAPVWCSETELRRFCFTCQIVVSTRRSSRPRLSS